MANQPQICYPQDNQIQSLLTQLQNGGLDPSLYALKDGLLLYKDKVCIRANNPFKHHILLHMHSAPLGGHSGYKKTYQRTKCDFYWFGMKKDIRQFIRECQVCQQHKVSHTLPAGLLQPLPIPTSIWTNISMDFIEGLPKVHGHTIILVVVD